MGGDVSHNMSDGSGKRRRCGVRTRMVFAFSSAFALILTVFVLIQFFGIPFTSYGGISQTYKQEAARGMTLITDLKEDRLRLWVRERRNDLIVLASNRPRLSNIIELEQAIREYRDRGVSGSDLWDQVRKLPIYQEVADRLNEIRATDGFYETMFIVDAESGTTIASTQEADLGENNNHEDFFRRVSVSHEEYVGGVQPSEHEGQLAVYFSRLMRTEAGEPAAVMVFEANAKEVFDPILHTGEGLGDRGEAVLVDRGLRILTSLKHRLPDGSAAKPLVYRFQSDPAVRAASGEKGVVEAIDYRGKPVLAAYRHLSLTPELGWGLIVKRDQDEMYAPLYRELAWSMVIAAVGLCAVIVLTTLLAQNLTKPIRALSRVAERVAQGDPAARAQAGSLDEIGLLSTTFNMMLDKIGAEREARSRQERLAVIGQLTGSVAHELRSPLGTIRTGAYVLLRKLEKQGSEFEPMLRAIDRSVTQADAIVSELLDYGRTGPLALKPVPIDEWLDRVLDEYIPPENVRVSRKMCAGNPPLRLEAERFRRCLLNLLTNACQAMQPGGGELKVGTDIRDGHVAISVSDTGCGISDEQKEKIFEPLFTTKSYGVGLGLPIVKQIVEQHGGRIDVDCTAGQGTTFSIVIPM